MSFLYQIYTNFPQVEFLIQDSIYLNISHLSIRCRIDYSRIESLEKFLDEVFKLILHDNEEERKFPLERKRLELFAQCGYASGGFSRYSLSDGSMDLRMLLYYISSNYMLGKTIVIRDSREESDIEKDISLENERIFKEFNYRKMIQ